MDAQDREKWRFNCKNRLTTACEPNLLVSTNRKRTLLEQNDDDEITARLSNECLFYLTDKQIEHDVSDDDVKADEVYKCGGFVSTISFPKIFRRCALRRLNLDTDITVGGQFRGKTLTGVVKMFPSRFFFALTTIMLEKCDQLGSQNDVIGHRFIFIQPSHVQNLICLWRQLFLKIFYDVTTELEI